MKLGDVPAKGWLLPFRIHMAGHAAPGRCLWGKDYLIWKYSFKNRTDFMHKCKAVLLLELRGWLRCHVSGCCISLVDILQDDSCCLCTFCTSHGAHAWTCIVESSFHTGSSDEALPLGCCLTRKATWYSAVVEGVWVPAELLSNVGLCQRPQIFPCGGGHRRKSPSGRGVRNRKHLGKSPTRQWHHLVRRDSHLDKLRHV